MAALDEPAVVGDGVACVARGDVLLSLWVAPASQPRWRDVVFAQLSRLVERQPAGVVVVQVILSSSSPPDMRTRAAVQGDLRSLGPRLRGVITLPVGDSLWQGLVRTLVRTMLLLSGHAKTFFVTGSLPQTWQRVQQLAGEATPTTGELRDALDQLCQALDLPTLAA
jgi:hypothetical protein